MKRDRHYAYEMPKASPVDAGWTKRRTCAVCKKTRSVTQFDGAELVCRDCKRRQ